MRRIDGVYCLKSDYINTVNERRINGVRLKNDSVDNNRNDIGISPAYISKYNRISRIKTDRQTKTGDVNFRFTIRHRL